MPLHRRLGLWACGKGRASITYFWRIIAMALPVSLLQVVWSLAKAMASWRRMGAHISSRSYITGLYTCSQMACLYVLL